MFIGLTQLSPFQNGSPQKLYFFLLPSYWFSSSRNKVTVGGNGVKVQNVRKTFGDFEAIKGVTLNLIPGEVTALLGHNGAGK
jgi:ABC-type polysaccharide/polyol phosphate transport system ATPase subunit